MAQEDIDNITDRHACYIDNFAISLFVEHEGEWL
jgi:hypothetical protein